MSGKQRLYNNLVPSSLPETEGELGKRNAYIEQRHDAMASRYYYYSVICRLRYDDCLLNLSSEFFLSTNMIVKCLLKREDFIYKLETRKVTTSELRRKYPFFDWSAKISLAG
jgi:hypothetical protein